MKNILFVDDERKVLDGLRRTLRRMRREWNMVFAEGAEPALQELEQERFDVVVSDLRMPGMDGAALLEHVQKAHPDAVRIVLSGHAEKATAMRVVPIAHQFLSKPCDADALRSVVERACALQQMLRDERLRSLVGGMDSLPALPSLYACLTRVLQAPDSSLQDVAEVVNRDAAMCAKMLQLVNSSFFGLPQRVSDIEKAVSLLGTNMVRNLALSVEVFRPFGAAQRVDGLSLEEEARHTALSGSLARRIAADELGRGVAEDAFMAGVLHDVGKLVLAAQMPREYGEILEEAGRTGGTVRSVELEHLGVSHAELGAYLLGVWGLPAPIVEAAAFHHQPAVTAASGLDVVLAVHVADVLAHELLDAGLRGGASGEALDEAHLQELGLSERLPAWRRAAEEVAEDAQQRVGGGADAPEGRGDDVIA